MSHWSATRSHNVSHTLYQAYQTGCGCQNTHYSMHWCCSLYLVTFFTFLFPYVTHLLRCNSNTVYGRKAFARNFQYEHHTQIPLFLQCLEGSPLISMPASWSQRPYKLLYRILNCSFVFVLIILTEKRLANKAWNKLQFLQTLTRKNPWTLTRMVAFLYNAFIYIQKKCFFFKKKKSFWCSLIKENLWHGKWSRWRKFVEEPLCMLLPMNANWIAEWVKDL